MIFISSVGSKCLITFCSIITGMKEAIDISKEIVKILILNGTKPKKFDKNNKHIIYDTPEAKRVKTIIVLSFEIEVKIFKN